MCQLSVIFSAHFSAAAYTVYKASTFDPGVKESTNYPKTCDLFMSQYLYTCHVLVRSGGGGGGE